MVNRSCDCDGCNKPGATTMPRPCSPRWILGDPHQNMCWAKCPLLISRHLGSTDFSPAHQQQLEDTSLHPFMLHLGNTSQERGRPQIPRRMTALTYHGKTGWHNSNWFEDFLVNYKIPGKASLFVLTREQLQLIFWTFTDILYGAHSSSLLLLLSSSRWQLLLPLGKPRARVWMQRGKKKVSAHRPCRAANCRRQDLAGRIDDSRAVGHWWWEQELGSCSLGTPSPGHGQDMG